MARALLGSVAGVLVGAASCGGGQRTEEPPSARAPELVAVAPTCDALRLKGFDPGTDGWVQVGVVRRPDPDAPLARTHEQVCEIVEDDETCQTRARRDVATADARAKIGDVAMSGERAGYAATLEVDGVRQSLRVTDERDVVVEAKRLQARGHRVVPVEGHVIYRADGRKAIVQYEVPLSGAASPMRWELELRGPPPSELASELGAMMGRLQSEVERAGLELVSFEIALDGVSAVLACP